MLDEFPWPCEGWETWRLEWPWWYLPFHGHELRGLQCAGAFTFVVDLYHVLRVVLD